MAVKPYEWTCPFCDKGSIVTEENSYQASVWFNKDNAHGHRVIFVSFIVCPNPKCREFTLAQTMFEYRKEGTNTTMGKRLNSWSLIPASSAKAFPNYVPKPILDDYVEACAIVDLSPKASATLSRRCLQGMIRDFWNIQKDRLIDEIVELKNRVDALTWSAIDAVRSVGNIGAHMEKDINVIVDVDPDEAAKLIGLIELLMRDWYILKHQRQENLSAIVAMSLAKKEAKEAQKKQAEPAGTKSEG